MKDLNYQLKSLCERNQDGSRSTQAERFQLLQTMASHLNELGYRRMEAKSLKPKHVDSLVAKYIDENLAPGTIKNRLAALRWWAEKIGKQNVVAKDTAYYGIESGFFVTIVSKARDLDLELL
ncbi:MAG: phage integrase N-terminal domain-containing protein [Cycloclasticus sp.]|nr:phage integrase N-terminal domain-containing protein [Cycloclasticus sp.]